MDTHLTNTSVLAELMGIESKTLHHWYLEHLSGFKPGGHEQIHANDIVVREYGKERVVDVPIVCAKNIGTDMAIDEKLIGDDYYTLITNRQTGKIAFCAASTKSDHLMQALVPLMSYLEKVENITRDMAACFAKLCDMITPRARQIADKFHVVCNLMDAQQAVRIRHRQKLLEERRKALQLFKQEEKLRSEECEREGKKFKARKFNYTEKRLSNGETPSEILARSHFLLYKFPNQWTAKQLVRANVLFYNYPDIQQAYRLSCQFRKWYAKENIGNHQIQLEKELFIWYEDVEASDIDEMLNFKSLVESNVEVIMEYFKNGHTNAIAENINGRIKKFIASNHGLRNRDFFFFRVTKFFA